LPPLSHGMELSPSHRNVWETKPLFPADCARFRPMSGNARLVCLPGEFLAICRLPLMAFTDSSLWQRKRCLCDTWRAQPHPGRDGGTGRRSGLKIRRPLRPWGFDPPSRHHKVNRLCSSKRILWDGLYFPMAVVMALAFLMAVFVAAVNH
jgi:hypothetical protein